MKRKINKRTCLFSFLHDMYLISAKGCMNEKSVTEFIVNGKNYSNINGHIYDCATKFVFEAFPCVPASIVWSLNGLEIPGSRNQPLVKVNYLPEGEYTLAMTVISGADEKNFTTSFFVIEDNSFTF